MAFSTKPVFQNVPLPMPVAILTMLSTILTFVILILSVLNLTNQPISQSNSSPWFDIGTSSVTLLFHLSTLVIIVLRLRSGPNVTSLSEKGLIQISREPQRSLFATTPVMAWFAILFAVWIVAVGGSLYEVMLRQRISSMEKGNIILMAFETVVVAVTAVYVFIDGRKLNAGQDDQSPRMKRFTTGELPRPLALKGTLQRNISKESIGNPSPPPTTLPEKIQPVNAMCSPPLPAMGPPSKALRPEPRYNGMRTLVLVDPRMEIAAQTSYHGSMSSNSDSSYSASSASTTP